MPADDILLDTEERMEKAISVLKTALSGVRTGRANQGLVDSLRVEVYGSPTPMKQVGSGFGTPSRSRLSFARTTPAPSRTSRHASVPPRCMA